MAAMPAGADGVRAALAEPAALAAGAAIAAIAGGCGAAAVCARAVPALAMRPAARASGVMRIGCKWGRQAGSRGRSNHGEFVKSIIHEGLAMPCPPHHA